MKTYASGSDAMRAHGRKCRLSPRDWRGPAKSINENGAIHSPDGFSFWEQRDWLRPEKHRYAQL
jgi:hypothetical protein